MGNGNGDGGRDEKEKREVEFVSLFGDRVYMPCGAVHVDQGVHSIYVRFPLNSHNHSIYRSSRSYMDISSFPIALSARLMY